MEQLQPPLKIRVDLLEALAADPNFLTAEEEEASSSAMERFIRRCPALSDPDWAMEELLRVSGKPQVWGGTTLPPLVWAEPGTAACPFETTPADFARY